MSKASCISQKSAPASGSPRATNDAPRRGGATALLASGTPARRPLQRILVKDGAKEILLSVGRVDRIEAEGNYVRLHEYGRSFTLRMTLAALSGRLDPDKFLRISRSAIVRLDAMKKLHPWFHGDYHVLMADGTTLTWTRRYRANALPELGGSNSDAQRT